MARHKRNTRGASNLGIILDFVDVVDQTFERLTGKPIAAWLKEFQQRARELPPGEEAVSPQPTMPLADAYAILGLKPNSPLDEVEKRYRVLANLFHPDKPGGYGEAMKLLNQAYERIQGRRGGSR
ncbi:hypothetical protein ES707_21722 [subsurface metagenome]